MTDDKALTSLIDAALWELSEQSALKAMNHYRGCGHDFVLLVQPPTDAEREIMRAFLQFGMEHRDAERPQDPQ